MLSLKEIVLGISRKDRLFPAVLRSRNNGKNGTWRWHVGFWKGVLRGMDRSAKGLISDENFLRGQNGDPPKVGYMTPQAQAVADGAYERGQKSVAAKLIRKLTEEE
jgi:hypothetical protein